MKLRCLASQLLIFEMTTFEVIKSDGPSNGRRVWNKSVVNEGNRNNCNLHFSIWLEIAKRILLCRSPQHYSLSYRGLRFNISMALEVHCYIYETIPYTLSQLEKS